MALLQILFIFQENSYDARYQQSRVVPGGRRFFKGDTLITECTYDSSGRDKPILGGYSASQVDTSQIILTETKKQIHNTYT